tara:strand:- start:91 stop:288 length:198 start_codon:yes stop_codon:yes gene_type:complete
MIPFNGGEYGVFISSSFLTFDSIKLNCVASRSIYLSILDKFNNERDGKEQSRLKKDWARGSPQSY